jgi:hypothetical protein
LNQNLDVHIFSIFAVGTLNSYSSLYVNARGKFTQSAKDSIVIGDKIGVSPWGVADFITISDLRILKG